jgi:ADP-ribose pyrophosphatase YjhB (NUDIX family)
MNNSGVPESAPKSIAYCPICTTLLETRMVGDKPRRACPSCGYIYFTDPKVGVGVLTLVEGKILLVQRAMMPEVGKWSLPAGYLDYGEDPRRTAVREVFEETGLDVEIAELLDVYHNPEAISQGGASVFILYLAHLVGGEIEAGDDAEDVGLFPPDDLPELAFSSTMDAIRRWQSGEYSSLE